MSIQQVLHHCWPHARTQTATDIDSDIREEFEFHLEMRTQDNIKTGMTPDEARRDAQKRFGDFEANRRACRKITLGPRILVARLQSALVVLLIVAVAYQGLLLYRIQTASRDKIESLTQQVAELQAMPVAQAPLQPRHCKNRRTLRTPPAMPFGATATTHWPNRGAIGGYLGRFLEQHQP